MSPFAGEGANLPMLDAAELAEEILATLRDLEGAIGRYQARMFTRSAAAAEESAANLEVCLAEDAPQGLVAQMMRHART
jgi:2-polyprenyl-6-methoxyphenol hydroxylase-like FAD-dependent oxidoreductase